MPNDFPVLVGAAVIILLLILALLDERRLQKARREKTFYDVRPRGIVVSSVVLLLPVFAFAFEVLPRDDMSLSLILGITSIGLAIGFFLGQQLARRYSKRMESKKTKNNTRLSIRLAPFFAVLLVVILGLTPYKNLTNWPTPIAMIFLSFGAGLFLSLIVVIARMDKETIQKYFIDSKSFFL